MGLRQTRRVAGRVVPLHVRLLLARRAGWRASGSARASLMCSLLPQSATRQRGERRPVILFSALYRVWACVRAVEFQHWLRAEGALPPSALSSAGFHAPAPDTADDEVAGLAGDLSKCYDRVPLATIEATARSALAPGSLAPNARGQSASEPRVGRRVGRASAHTGLSPGLPADALRAGGGRSLVAAGPDLRLCRVSRTSDGPWLRMGTHQGLRLRLWPRPRHRCG